MLVTLTAIQRISVESLMAVRENKLFEEQLVAYELLCKIRLTKSERASAFDVINDGSGRSIANPNAIESIPDREVDLSISQITELKNILATAKVKVGDVEWYIPLKQQLDKPIDMAERDKDDSSGSNNNSSVGNDPAGRLGIAKNRKLKSI